PAKHLRVNRPHEGVHAIETFWCRAGRQPFEIAVGARDIAVRAGRDVDDDFAALRHESDLRWRKAKSNPRGSAVQRSGVQRRTRCDAMLGSAGKTLIRCLEFEPTDPFRESVVE